MASNLDFVEYVCDQIGGAGSITYKKMFGEYGVYCDGKVIGVICDNQFFVKKTEAGVALYPDCKEAAPYTGAKPHFITDNVDDRERMARECDYEWVLNIREQCVRSEVTFWFKNTGSLFRHDGIVERINPYQQTGRAKVLGIDISDGKRLF